MRQAGEAGTKHVDWLFWLQLTDPDHPHGLEETFHHLFGTAYYDQGLWGKEEIILSLLESLLLWVLRKFEGNCIYRRLEDACKAMVICKINSSRQRLEQSEQFYYFIFQVYELIRPQASCIKLVNLSIFCPYFVEGFTHICCCFVLMQNSTKNSCFRMVRWSLLYWSV